MIYKSNELGDRFYTGESNMNAAKVIFFPVVKYRCLPLFLVKLQCSVLFCMVHACDGLRWIGQSA